MIIDERYEGDDGSCGAEEEEEAASATSGDENAAAAGTSGETLLDAVRIEIRRGEIVITIRGDALATAAAQAPAEVMRAALPSAYAPPAGRSARAMTRGPAASAFVGLATAPADKYRGGYSQVQMRADLVESYRSAHRHVHALGGVLTSSGGIRDLSEKATAGRSKTSLHYTGRAIDLFIYSGMQRGEEPYLVTRAGGTDANPEWKVYCVSTTPMTASPLYDPALIAEQDIECVRWVQGVGYETYTRRTTCFSLTDVMARYGWEPIPARGSWKTVYTSCEWWHFQNAHGLTPGATTFGEQLMQVWPSDVVRASGLTLEAVWAGRSFRADGSPAAPVRPAGGDADSAEKLLWAQTVLNAVANAGLSADGKMGPRSREALRSFQTSNGIAARAILDAATEAALLQRALERLDGSVLPRIGVLDDDTVRALTSFQRFHGLKADGQSGPKTRAAMVSALSGRVPRSAPRERATTRHNGEDGGTSRKRRGVKRTTRSTGRG
jgi:peptidoglycan hydrolase-like protein with peptidoglycan-binding domain